MPERKPVILVLDDEPMVTSTIKSHLALEGDYETIAFNHPAEALEHLKTHPVDLIVSDQMMPDMNGLEFFAQARQIQPEAIRVLLTGYAQKEHAIRAINEIGLWQFLEKPWSNEQLSIVIRNGLERKRLYTSLQEKISQLQIAADEIDRLKNGLVELYLERSVKPASGEPAAAEARRELRRIVGAEIRSGTRRFARVFLAASLLLAASISYVVYKSFFAIRQETARLKIQIGELKSRQLNPAEIERLRAAAAQPRELNPSERIIAQYQGSVCYIHGSFVFSEPESDRLLRLAAPGPGSAPQVDASGNADVTLEGNGPVLENSYSGTGFLVTPDGKILTNRHVGEPWWANAQAERLVAAGLRPKHRNFVAYFPHRPEPFALQTLKISESADLALLQAEPAKNLPQPIPLEQNAVRAAAGAPVLLIGYPLGLEAVLARISESDLSSIPNYLNLGVDQVARELAKRNLIHPFISQGHISNVSKDVVTYDAVTTMGGSGGPLFNQDGKVIGIHFGNLAEFAGGNLGVPISHALSLLGK